MPLPPITIKYQFSQKRFAKYTEIMFFFFFVFSCRRSHFSKIFSSETPGPINAKLHVEHP